MEIDPPPETGESERKRENRLTNIVDQLLHNKTSQRRSALSSEGTKVERGNHLDDEKSASLVKLSKTVLENKTRRKKVAQRASAIDIKDERCSPDPSNEDSLRIASPQTPSPGSSLCTRTPSFAGTPPVSSFSPTGPTGLAYGTANSSSAIGSNKVIMDGLHMSRNYSDFMRNLAAKYNNSNANDYRNAGGFVPLLDSRISPFKGSIGDPSSSASAAISALAAFPQFAFPIDSTARGMSVGSSTKDADSDNVGKRDKKEEYAQSFGLSGLVGDPSVPHLSLGTGLPNFSMIDMSSTQTLLNMVRSANSRNAQHIESYLRGSSGGSPVSLKRPAESATTSLTAHSPLDLSAPLVKRPYLEPQSDVRGFLREPVVMKSSAASDPESFPIKKKYLQSEDKTVTVSSYAASPREKRVPTPNKVAQSPQFNCRSTCAADSCSPAAVEVNRWSVNEVVDFVKSIDLCAEYAEVFRDNSIDGSTLPLLTEDHLTSTMNMKLGPALKLRSVLAKKIGHCAVCLHCAHCHTDAIPSTPSQSIQE